MDTYVNRSDVYVGLRYNVIQPCQVVDYLEEVRTPESIHLVAYHHYLLFQRERHVDPVEMTTTSGRRFIQVCSPDYILIYIGFEWADSGAIFLDIAEWTRRLALGLQRYYTQVQYRRWVDVITGQATRLDKDEIDLACRSRQYDFEFAAPLSTVRLALLRNHATTQVSGLVTSELNLVEISAMIEAMEVCRDVQPSIWLHVRQLYETMIRELLNRHAMSYSPVTHPRLASLFPGIFHLNPINRPHLVWTLYYMDPTRAGYYLGMSIRHMIPTRSDVASAAMELDALGLDAYAHRHHDRNRDYHQGRLACNLILAPTSPYEYRFINHLDSLHNDVFDYSPADLHVFAGQHGRFFIFTGADFPGLLMTRRNFYTNEDISTPTMEFIQREVDGRTLPPPEPLLDLLTTLEGSIPV